MSTRFHRIVRTDPPTEFDFMSQERLGVELFDPDLEKIDMWRGISVFATETQARNKARAYPQLGQFIAAIEIEEVGPIRFRGTGETRGHHTLWGDAAELVRLIIAVSQV